MDANQNQNPASLALDLSSNATDRESAATLLARAADGERDFTDVAAHLERDELGAAQAGVWQEEQGRPEGLV